MFIINALRYSHQNLINFDLIPVGYSPPNDVNVVVEIPKGSNIKYEIDKEIGILRMDRRFITIDDLSW